MDNGNTTNAAIGRLTSIDCSKCAEERGSHPREDTDFGLVFLCDRCAASFDDIKGESDDGDDR